MQRNKISNSVIVKYINRAPIIAMGVLGLCITGCGASKQRALLETVESPVVQNRPADRASVEADLTTARNLKVNLVSPKYFGRAQAAFDEAQRLGESSDDQAKKNDLLKSARENLDKANRSFSQSGSVMQPLIESRQGALDVGAAKTPGFVDLEKKFVAISDGLDSDDRTKSVEDIPELSEHYRKITLATVEAEYLSPAIENIKTAEREEAGSLVPKSLATAKTALKSAQDYIAKDFRNKEMVSQLAQQAIFESRRTLALTRQIKSWDSLSKEDLALKMEGLLASINTGLEGPDLRDESFEASTTKMTELAAHLRKTEENLTAEADELKTKMTSANQVASSLESKTKEVSKLQEQAAVEEKYQEIRKMFSETEANVSRQNDKIIIGLKTINFKSGDSKVPTDAFALLEKAHKAIGLFETPSIVVEGHTDSTGNPTLNKALSEERARAIKQYLASVNVTPEDKIQTVGFGAEKPLASNQTKEGRATNRRINVVILAR